MQRLSAVDHIEPAIRASFYFRHGSDNPGNDLNATLGPLLLRVLETYRVSLTCPVSPA